MAQQGGRIELSLEYLIRLKSITHPEKFLRDYGYIRDKLTPEQIDRKRRCKNCHKMIGGKPEQPKEGTTPKFPKSNPKIPVASSAKAPLPGKQSSSGLLQGTTDPAQAEGKKESEPKLRCKFHKGELTYQRSGPRLWSCCKAPASTPPCGGAEFHVPAEYSPGFIESNWQYHLTPNHTGSTKIFDAVAIDCEMGTAETGDSEVIRITMIDYFSAAILIDKLVWPDVPMKHLNTKYSGITWNDLNTAYRRGECFLGRDAARRAIFTMVDPKTIVVGHSVSNDLNVLRWIHDRLIDTNMIEIEPEWRSAGGKKPEHKKEDPEAKDKSMNPEGSIGPGKTSQDSAKNATYIKQGGLHQEIKPADVGKAASDEKESGKPDAKPKQVEKKPKGSGPLSLKSLTKVRLGRDIQTGNSGHDSFEDALATRDLAHWQVLNKPKVEVPDESW